LQRAAWGAGSEARLAPGDPGPPSATESVAFAFILWQLIQEMGFEAAIVFVFLLVAASPMLRPNALRSQQSCRRSTDLLWLLSSTPHIDVDLPRPRPRCAGPSRRVLHRGGAAGTTRIQLIFMTAEG
jgi:hypothetical protein